ncbi:hypothetical protein ACLB2K_051898 [Fragaria x ananassa]
MDQKMSEVDDGPGHAGRAREEAEDDEPREEDDENVGGPYARVGNIGVASGDWGSLSRKLPISTLLRNMGFKIRAFSCHLENTLDLISRLKAVDVRTIKDYLNLYSGALVRELETVVQIYGVAKPYEKLKEQTGGETRVTKESIVDYIQGMEVPD